MLVVLFEGGADDALLGGDCLGRLARLGVSSVCLLRDRHGAAVVLEGWSLGVRQGPEAIEILRANGGRLLEPFAQLSLGVS